MFTERRQALATFFGGLMLAVQLRVLYRFVEQLRHDVDITEWVDRRTLLQRMAWLKAPLWQEPRFAWVAGLLVLVCAALATGLWALGVRRWYRAARATRTER